MTMTNHQDVEALIIEAVEELVEELEIELENHITAETLLVADVEFSSIDFVQLIVTIEEKLGRKIGFQEMLLQDGKYVDDLSIGQVVAFTNERLQNNQAASQPATPATVAASTESIASGTEQALTEADVQTFTRLIKPRRPSRLTQAKNPRAVFILSPPRSGSTLLRVMLAGNPSLFAPPELHLLSYATMDERREDLSSEHSLQLLDGTVRALMQARNCSGDEARQIISDFESKQMGTAEFFGLLQESLKDQLLIDKTPTYAFSVDILQQAEACFENPLYIHLLRHPCGMVRSYEESSLTRMMPLLMQSGNFSMRSIAELIWLISNRNILEFSKSVPQERWASVSYENIVQNPEAEMQQLCAFMGVDFHPDMLNPYGDREGRMTDGVDSASKMSGDLKFHLHSQIDPQAATRWKQFSNENMLGAPTRDLMMHIDTEVARIRL